MGDVISTLPALTDATKAILDIRFDWVVEENFSEIPAWHSAVDKVIPVALRRWRKSPFSFASMQEAQTFLKKLRAEEYDCIIDAQGLLKSAIVSALARGARCGFSKGNVREPLASYLYQNKFDIKKHMHTIERARELFSKSLGYSILEGDLDYGPIKERFNSDDKSQEKYLVFIHSASRSEKCWQVEKWIELAKLAKGAGLKVKLPWGNRDELERANSIAAVSDNAEVLPKSTLTEVGKVLFGAAGIVTVDTGLGHLAAALDVPSISLYGPTDPALIGACGKGQIHLTDMHSLNAEVVWKKLQ